MTRLFLACALWLVALVSPAAAQAGGFGLDEPEVRFELYHRIDGDQVRVAIRTTLKRKWHLYHTELGGEGAIGTPTVVTFESDEADFSAPVFPKPHRVTQEIADTWILQHEGRFAIYALAELDDPESAEDFEFSVQITGQVCDVGGVCIPVKEVLESKGAGPDAVFASFPDAAVFAGDDGAGDAEASGETTDGNAHAVAPLFDEAPKQVDSDKLSIELYLRESADRVEAVMAFDIQDHWHIASDRLRDPADLGDEEPIGSPTLIQLKGTGAMWNAPVFPEAMKFTDKWGSPWILAHEGRVLVYLEGEKTGEVSGVEAWYSGQACDDSVCVTFSGVVAPSGAGSDEDFAAARALADFEGPEGAAASAKLGTTDPEDEDGDGQGGLLQFILLAIGGGLFALVMPCTYPMIPITISFFTKQADARGGSVLPLSLAYGAGIVAIFVLIGVVAGPFIIPFAQAPATNLIIGIAFLFFSLALFGAINLQPPAFLMSAAGKASMKGGYIGVFLMGMTLVVTSFTCTAPFVGSLLAVGAAGGGEPDYTRIALGMGVFGLTMAVPFFFLSLVPGRVSAMPKGGEWMNTIKVTLGFVEIAAALKFISNADIVLEWGVLSRELFLLLWAAIFVLTAAYLFGFIQIKGKRPEEIGAARSVFAIGFLLFGVYCWHGYTGHQMDNIMTAMAPPYSSQLGGSVAANGNGAHGGGAESWQIVLDDYETARSQALAQNKTLFINFTGHT